jgi:hypothetical protein
VADSKRTAGICRLSELEPIRNRQACFRADTTLRGSHRRDSDSNSLRRRRASATALSSAARRRLRRVISRNAERCVAEATCSQAAGSMPSPTRRQIARFQLARRRRRVDRGVTLEMAFSHGAQQESPPLGAHWWNKERKVRQRQAAFCQTLRRNSARIELTRRHGGRHRPDFLRKL